MSELPREWHGGTLAPGTPRPMSYTLEATCSECETISLVSQHSELGQTWLEPEECPNCDRPWGEEVQLDAHEPDPPEPDYGHLEPFDLDR